MLIASLAIVTFLMVWQVVPACQGLLVSQDKERQVHVLPNAYLLHAKDCYRWLCDDFPANLSPAFTGCRSDWTSG